MSGHKGKSRVVDWLCPDAETGPAIMEPLLRLDARGEDFSVPGLWRSARGMVKTFHDVHGAPAEVALQSLTPNDVRLIKNLIRAMEAVAMNLTLATALGIAGAETAAASPVPGSPDAPLPQPAEQASPEQPPAQESSGEACVDVPADLPAARQLQDPADPATWRLRYPVARVCASRRAAAPAPPPALVAGRSTGRSADAAATQVRTADAVFLSGPAPARPPLAFRLARRARAAMLVIVEPEAFILRLAQRLLRIRDTSEPAVRVEVRELPPAMDRQGFPQLCFKTMSQAEGVRLSAFDCFADALPPPRGPPA